MTLRTAQGEMKQICNQYTESTKNVKKRNLSIQINQQKNMFFCTFFSKQKKSLPPLNY
jgi:hypothetical protein